MARKYKGMAGHFISAHSCCHHITTEIDGKYLVSTVGCYHPEHKRARSDYDWELADIGYGRKFETFVFRLRSDGLGVVSFSEIDSDGYNDAGAADAGHEAMCQKYEALNG